MPPIRRWSLIVLISLLLTTLVPSHSMRVLAHATPSADVHVPPVPIPQTVAPIQDPHLPSLVVSIAVTPNPVIVGEAAQIAVTIFNQAPDPAQDLSVSLPLPAGTRAASKQDRWEWTQPILAGSATTTFTATVEVPGPLPGDALLAHASVIAEGLLLAVEERGGAVVAPTTPEAVSMQTRPGSATILKQPNTVEVRFAPNTTRNDLTITARRTPGRGESVAPLINGKRGLPPVFLSATTRTGQAVHRFAAPLTLIAQYTPEQLEALGIAEADLSLFWFDEAAVNGGQWVLINSIVDPTTQTVQASVDHFSAYALGDGSSPSKAYLPSLQAWQVGLYSGTSSYGMPIDVPAGPAGIKPNVTLSYGSAATDGTSGLRAKQQAGWVGKGWSLDTGSVMRNKIMVNSATGEWVDHYVLAANGIAADVVRAEPLTGNTGSSDPDPTHWAWRATDETFVRVQVVSNGFSWADSSGNPQRGGYDQSGWLPRTTWQLWTKDGTRYDFSDDLWNGWNHCDTANVVRIETYKWLLSQVIDTHGNTITYSYGRQTSNQPQYSCDAWKYGRALVDQDTWPTSITWGANTGTGSTDRYRVDFVSSARTNDTAFDGADTQYGVLNGQPRETRRLDAIQVKSKQASTWELVRQYNLGYDYTLLSDQTVSGQPQTAYPKLTLKSIQRIAKDGVTALPTMTFTYEPNRGTGTWSNGAWNRLTQANNGQGGTVSFTYEHIGQAVGKTVFQNQRRVTAKTTTDGQGNTATWTYSYGTPQLNSLGSNLTGSSDPNATQAYPNSATLYYNKYWSQTDNIAWLASRPTKEFRGHDYVKETDPVGGQTEHWFYQGDRAQDGSQCTPPDTAKGTTILTDACFLQLRTNELLKGKEYRTRVLGPTSQSSPVLEETKQHFATSFFDMTWAPLSGLWRAWHATDQTEVLTWNGATTSSQHKTTYSYDSAQQAGGTWYGNLSKTEEYANGTLVRATKRWYLTQATATSYVVDRMWQEIVTDAQGGFLTLTNYFFDQTTNAQTIGTEGELHRETKYYDLPVPAVNSLAGLTIHGTDTVYGYDAYGNQTAVSSYPQASTRTNPGTITWGGAGNGSSARTVSTTYDAIFHAQSIQVTSPTVNGVTILEQASYDARMGTMTSVTDPNGNVSSMTYDAFGRLSDLVKPGDTLAYPTLHADYADWEQPMRFTTCQREIAGQVGCRISSSFFDGLGQVIQTKQESAEASQNIVVTTRYTPIGQVAQQSSPSYVQETPSTTFYDYIVPAPTVQWTTTSYDALGRVTMFVEPNGAQTRFSYAVNNGQRVDTIIDANRYRTDTISDPLGRLVHVQEFAGNCGDWEYTCVAPSTTLWSSVSQTSYTYSPLDLLTKVSDALGNETRITYDSLGRKQTMHDPDMGDWSYTYDNNGNLLTQTDAKQQTLTFAYDALERLMSKTYPGGGQILYSYDQGVHGKGMRTGISKPSASMTWQYDSRGRVSSETWSIPEKTGSWVISRSYDSADRPATLTYPNGETVAYSYDAAGRPISLCSTNLTPNTCYLSNRTYRADKQPQSQTFGNGVVQTWQFDTQSARVTQNFLDLGATALFGRVYSYDLGGNVATIGRRSSLEVEHFSYDHRDRLTRAWTTDSSYPYDETFTYNVIGNLTAKAGVTYSYPASGATSTRPHAVTSRTNEATYTYDANGNMLTGRGRTYVWNADNQPTSITGQDSVTETYRYDGELKRSTRTRAGIMTAYINTLWEEDLQTGTTRSLYFVDNQIIAQRTQTSSTTSLIYLHSDHVNSISVVTDSAGAILNRQDYTPWGEARALPNTGLTQTTFNYTGQRKDGTGLLYYQARYYDPVLARWSSADTLIPDEKNNVVGIDPKPITPLTVGFSETGLLRSLNAEQQQRNIQGLLAQDTRHIGPQDVQALNRYSYVLNNPIKYTDPSGHKPKIPGEAESGGSGGGSGAGGNGGGGWSGPGLGGGAKGGGGMAARKLVEYLIKGGAAKEAMSKLVPKAADLQLSDTVAKKAYVFSKDGGAARPYMLYDNWRRIVQWIMDAGVPIADTGNSRGKACLTCVKWVVEGNFNASRGVWELVVNLENNTIVHWVWKSYH